MGKFLRSLLLLAICFMLVAPRPSLASVGVQEEDGTIHQATNINFIGATVTQDSVDAATVDVNIVSSSLFAIGMNSGGVSLMVTGSSTIPVANSVVDITITTRTVTLPDGGTGQLIVLRGIFRGSGTLTIVADTATTWNNITMDANGETVSLIFVNSTIGWLVVGQDEATVTYVNTTAQ